MPDRHYFPSRSLHAPGFQHFLPVLTDHPSFTAIGRCLVTLLRLGVAQSAFSTWLVLQDLAARLHRPRRPGISILNSRWQLFRTDELFRITGAGEISIRTDGSCTLEFGQSRVLSSRFSFLDSELSGSSAGGFRIGPRPKMATLTGRMSGSAQLRYLEEFD